MYIPINATIKIKITDQWHYIQLLAIIAVSYTHLSRRIPRAPRYSGYYYASTTFEYATVMLYGLSFQKVLL